MNKYAPENFIKQKFNTSNHHETFSTEDIEKLTNKNSSQHS